MRKKTALIIAFVITIFGSFTTANAATPVKNEIVRGNSEGVGATVYSGGEEYRTEAISELLDGATFVEFGIKFDGKLKENLKIEMTLPQELASKNLKLYRYITGSPMLILLHDGVETGESGYTLIDIGSEGYYCLADTEETAIRFVFDLRFLGKDLWYTAKTPSTAFDTNKFKIPSGDPMTSQMYQNQKTGGTVSLPPSKPATSSKPDVSSSQPATSSKPDVSSSQPATSSKPDVSSSAPPTVPTVAEPRENNTIIYVIGIIAALIIIALIINMNKKQKLINSYLQDTEELKKDKQKLIKENVGKCNEITKKTEEVAKLKDELEKAYMKNKNVMGEISHELRIPISIIKGYANILSEGLVDDETIKIEYLNKIYNRIELLNDMVNGLLSDPKYGEQIIVAEHKRINLRKLIENTVEYYSLAAKSKNVNIFVNSNENAIFVYADQIKIAQVFNNLFENCFKYMNRGGTVTVTMSIVDKKEVLIVVKDDGEGMNSDLVAKVFERDFRGEKCQNKKGAGLGLYIVREIVESHGGRIWAKSEIDKGMSIYVVIPISEE